MNHAEVRSRMADYLEGDLELSKRALLDGHLDGCESCSHEFAQLRETIRLLRSLPDCEPPALLVENVMRRIRSGEGSVRLTDRIRAGLSLLARPQVAVPATALAVGLMLASGELASWPLPTWLLGSEPERPRMTLRWDSVRLPSLLRTGARGVNPQLPEDLARSQLAHNAALVSGRSQVVADGLEALRRRQAGSSRALSIHIAAPPPAVARAPRISIQIPIGTTGAEAGSARVVTRWPSRSILAPAQSLAASSVPRTGPVANRVVQASGVDAAAFQSSAFTPRDRLGERERRKRAELDGRLGRMIQRPAAFSREFASLTTTEQEIWLQALADYALEENRGEEAVRRLRLAADPMTLQLATAFSAELRRMRTQDRPEVASVAGEVERR